MTDISHIEQAVMRRVRLIRLLRIVISIGALAIIVAAFSLWEVGREVWVARVFENGPSGFFNRIGYFAYAFLNTSLSVQALVILVVASASYLAYEASRFVRRYQPA